MFSNLPYYMQEHPWLWFFFNGVPAPFSNPETYWVDCLRVIVIMAGTTIAGTSISEARNSGVANPLRTVCMVALSLFAIITVLTEFGRMGSVCSIRVFLTLAANVFGVWTMRLLQYRIGGRRVFPPKQSTMYEDEGNDID